MCMCCVVLLYKFMASSKSRRHYLLSWIAARKVRRARRRADPRANINIKIEIEGMQDIVPENEKTANLNQV